MKKGIIFLMSCIIVIQSYAIYKLVNKTNPVITKNIVTSSSPQIIYKDKIIYKSDDLDYQIESDLIQYLKLNKSYKFSYPLTRNMKIIIIQNLDTINEINGGK